MVEFIIFVIGLVATYIGVGAYLRYCHQLPILDIPNERSSHSNPVPRGGGIVIVVVALAAYLAVSAGTGVNWAYFGTALLIAAVGLLDDIYSLPLFPRLFVHFSAAATLVYCSGSVEAVSWPGFEAELDFGVFAPWLTVMFIVGMTNAYNFMDGIDGIAGIQGLTVGFGWIFVGIASSEPPLTTAGAIFAGCCLGFLLHNWPPAKIFLGDVGSTFLGFSFAAFPLIFARSIKMPVSIAAGVAIILLWLFVFDTMFTRVIQVLRLKAFWRPHREHLYQRLVLAGEKHYTVGLFYGVAGMAIATMTALAMGGSQPFGILLALSLALSAGVLLFWVNKKIDVSL